jgi:hypothetical protein
MKCWLIGVPSCACQLTHSVHQPCPWISDSIILSSTHTFSSRPNLSALMLPLVLLFQNHSSFHLIFLRPSSPIYLVSSSITFYPHSLHQSSHPINTPLHRTSRILQPTTQFSPLMRLLDLVVVLEQILRALEIGIFLNLWVLDLRWGCGGGLSGDEAEGCGVVLGVLVWGFGRLRMYRMGKVKATYTNAQGDEIG